MTERYWTMAAIKEANAAVGGHWFSRGALHFFSSRLPKSVHQGPGGVYFVTSEQFLPSRGDPAPRRYTVREFDPVTGNVDTVGDFNVLPRERANHYARMCAAGAKAAVLEAMEVGKTAAD